MPWERKDGNDALAKLGEVGGAETSARLDNAVETVEPSSRMTMYVLVSVEPSSCLSGMVDTVPCINVVEPSVGVTETRVPGGKGSGTCGLSPR